MDGSISSRQTLGSPLRGKIDGRQHFGLLCAALSGVRPGGVVSVDFSGIEDVSASWIAAAVLPLLTWSAAPETDLYPVFAGILGNEKRWEDEFELVANRASAVFMAVEADGRAKLIGTLDPILVETLQAVQKHREVTGAGLKRLFTTENIGATAWSNRLKDLYTKRLVRRTTRGREQVYTTVLEVNFDGTASSGIPDRKLPAADAT